MEDKINTLLELHNGQRFIVNDRFTCEIKQDIVPFNGWTKDINSPAFLTEAKVDVYDAEDSTKRKFNGLVVVYDDEALSTPLDAILYINVDGNGLSTMSTIVNIEFA